MFTINTFTCLLLICLKKKYCLIKNVSITDKILVKVLEMLVLVELVEVLKTLVKVSRSIRNVSRVSRSVRSISRVSKIIRILVELEVLVKVLIEVIETLVEENA